MIVLSLTILISVCLAAIFIVCCVGELRKPRKRGIEHHALMPLEDDSCSDQPTRISQPNTTPQNETR